MSPATASKRDPAAPAPVVIESTGARLFFAAAVLLGMAAVLWAIAQI